MAILDCIAILPARGGSKRIPDKNIQDFFGKPIIAYSILNAIKSGLFSRIIVSTDSCRIAKIAQRYGAEIPFMRDPSLSDDHTSTLEVISHMITQCEIPDETLICCLYPATPLMQASHLMEAYKIFTSKLPLYVFVATAFSFSPFRGFTYTDQKIKMLFGEYENTRSQDLRPIYHDAGQFYFGLARTFRQKQPIFSPLSIPLILEEMQVQDIDTFHDLELAKLKYKLLNAQN